MSRQSDAPHFDALLDGLCACSPTVVDGDPDLDRALAFLGSDRDSATLRTAALGLGTLTAAVGLVLAVLPVPGTAPLVALVVGCLGAYALVAVPPWLATARRARALGALPDMVGLAVLNVRVAPNGERAAVFAAEHGTGPLAASLREHARRSRGAPGDGWDEFAATWSGWAPSLRRAVSLLGAAVDAPPAERDRLLDRALRTVLDGTRERARTFAASIRGPTSALYAFGVVLPLALVAVLPAARAAGVAVTVPLIAVGYDLLLPLALVLGGAHLLARRPVTFPPMPVDASHPDVPDRRRRTVLLLGAGVAVAAWVATPLVAPAWARWVVVPGLVAGTVLREWFSPVTTVREHTNAIEAGLADALAVVGHRLRRGVAPETAVRDASEELSGPVGDVFADAARTQRNLRTTVEGAFLGDAGALAAVPSDRVRACVRLIGLAGREGADGGRVLVETADHVDALRAVERDARHDLATTVSTLRSTACCFAPLVGGATVALAGGFSGVDAAATAPPLSASALGVVVGWYVLLLGAILAGLASGLERGLDRAVVGYHAGGALLAAAVVYPVAVRGAGLLL